MQTFWVRLKIWLKIDIFDHSACNGWNLAKSRNFQFRFKFGSKFTFLTTLDLGRLKFGKILTYFSHVENLAQNWHFWPLRTWEGWSLAKFRNFQSRWKFGLNWEFDHSGAAKDEIWLNPEILSRLENLAQNWHFWPPRIFQGWNLAKSRNFDNCWNLAQNWHFSPLKRPGRMKFDKI